MDTEHGVTTDTKIEPKKNHRAHPKHPAAARPRAAARKTRPVIRGQDGTQWKDVYQFVLTVSWSQFVLGLAAVYLAINAFFAVLYLASPGGIVGVRPGSFADAFFFSVETFGSIGSGLLASKTTYVNIIVTIESFVTLVNLAIWAGLIFARFSRPFARVLFSNVAVVVPFNGVPTLMFRAANQRANQILDATATVSIARQATTQEGIIMRRFEELKLVRARTPLFTLSWTVMHQIDETSPLYGATHESCDEDDTEIIVLLSGTDETLSQVIYARHVYEPDDILFDQRFVNVLHLAESGRMEVDLHRFHDTKPWP